MSDRPGMEWQGLAGARRSGGHGLPSVCLPRGLGKRGNLRERIGQHADRLLKFWAKDRCCFRKQVRHPLIGSNVIRGSCIPRSICIGWKGVPGSNVRRQIRCRLRPVRGGLEWKKGILNNLSSSSKPDKPGRKRKDHSELVSISSIARWPGS